jgi:hypothetical protein
VSGQQSAVGGEIVGGDSSVSVAPGETMFAVIPRPPNSRARLLDEEER